MTDDALIKRPEPGHRYTDTDKAHALGVFLDSNGDLLETHKKLGGVPPAERLREWRKEFNWDVYLDKMRSKLVHDTVNEVTQRKRQDLRMLNAAKFQLAKHIAGQKNKDGDVIIAPLKPRTLESAASALARIMELEYRIRGEDLDGEGAQEQTQNFFLTLIRNAMGEADSEIRDSDRAETAGPPAEGAEAARIGADNTSSSTDSEGGAD